MEGTVSYFWITLADGCAYLGRKVPVTVGVLHRSHGYRP
jgi:hypothetical protein